jgi:YHS domain-containing protein
MTQLTRVVCIVLLSAGMSAAPKERQILDALDGLDPVVLLQGKEVMGKSSLSVVRGGFTYLFSTPETKAAFEREPAKYEIQFGGLCARMGKTAGGNPSDFLVHDGKIYIFGSDECHKRFQAAPAKYVPPAPAPLSESSSAVAEGKRLVDRAVTAVGGALQLDALTSYVESFTQMQQRRMGEIQVATKVMWRFPDRARQEQTANFQGKTNTTATVWSPEGAWFVGGQGQAYPMPAASAPSLARDFGRHPVALLRARLASGFKAVAVGTSDVDGSVLQNVRVVHGPLDVTLSVDSQGRLASVSFQDRGPEGEYGSFVVRYSDFRRVEGLTLPFGVRTTFNGQPEPNQSWTVDSIALNAPLDAALFAPTPKSEK